MYKKGDIVFVQRIAPVYRNGVFQLLFNNFGVEIWNGKNISSSIKEEDGEYLNPVNALKFSSNENHVWLIIFWKLIRKNPSIIIHEFSISMPSLYIAFLYKFLFRKNLILFGHGFNRSKGFVPEINFSDKLRVRLMKFSNAVILYSTDRKTIISKYVNKSKLFVAQNTLNTPSLLKVYSNLEKSGLENVKRNLNIEKKFVFSFVGRLKEEKLLIDALDAINILPERIKKQCVFYVIGDGFERENIESKIVELKLEQIVIMKGAIYDDVITSSFLYCSDLLLIPGALGLSVNHALLFGCPIISYKQTLSGPFHGPESGYVVNGKTGFFSEPGVTDLSNNIIRSLDYFNSEKKKEIINYSHDELVIENMLSGFERAFKHCKK